MISTLLVNRGAHSVDQSGLMFDERPIAFAGHAFECATVQYFNDTSRIGNNALILDLNGDLGHGCPANSKHFGK